MNVLNGNKISTNIGILLMEGSNLRANRNSLWPGIVSKWPSSPAVLLLVVKLKVTSSRVRNLIPDRYSLWS
jgi:hypothetical protein